MATKISALYVTRNEWMLQKSIECIYDYVDEIIIVNNGDSPVNIPGDKIKVYDWQYIEPVDMGAIRSFSIEKSTGDWIWQIDADEWYPKESCMKIVQAVNDPGNAISFRVPYYQMSWRAGYAQANFDHKPDRLYRRDVIDNYSGMLPNDMTKVKKEYYRYRPFLEYDNKEDKSFINPVQPVIDAPFYHLARTRGYNYEFTKWVRYNKNLHPTWSIEQCKSNANINQWVTGLYDLKKVDCPFVIPAIQSPKVSVIIPNFQYAQWVGKAIESVQNQTHGAYEIIVVDDGSHDNSREVIDTYDVIKIYTHNTGVAAARNTGIFRSTGDYFICLDSDDELAPTYIETMLKNIEPDIQVVYSDLQFMGIQHNGIVHKYPPFNINTLKRGQCIPSACALIDRRVFEAVGGFDPSEWYEDYGWWLRIATKGYNFKHVPEPLFKYRTHGPSRITELDKKQREGFQQLKERYGKIC